MEIPLCSCETCFREYQAASDAWSKGIADGSIKPIRLVSPSEITQKALAILRNSLDKSGDAA